MSDEIVIEYKQEGITPFWRKLPFFFLFPFRFGPLVFLACIIAASALAGLALGGFGLAFKGFLVYLGLRYAFNVLELFSQGRFEGESVDHTLWGPEKRPAKVGLVIVLFLVISVVLGNALVSSRIAGNASVQAQLIELYKKDHAAEIAERQREIEAFNKRVGLPSSAETAPPADVAANGGAADADDGPGSSNAEPGGSGDPQQSAQEAAPPAMAAAASVPAAAAQPTPAQIEASLYGGLTREEILLQYQPAPGDALWLKLLPAWYWVVIALLSLILPSATIVIALEDRFFKSLNPAHVVDLIRSMGSAYFALWALFLLIAGARHAALTVGEHWPAAVRFPVEMGLATYLALALFAMIGYALYQFHQELSLDVKVDFDSHRAAGGAESIASAGSAQAALRNAGKVDPLETKIQGLLGEGKVKEAIAEVKDLMRYDRFDPDLNTRLHPLYVLQGDQPAVLAHGQQWLTALARANRGEEALKALQSLQAIDPQFTPQDGDVILPVATAAAKKREFDLALTLMRSFDKRFPKHKDTAAVFFLSAKLASEHLRKHESAARILRAVVAHFPEDAVAAEARNYLKVLENIMAQTAAGQAG